MTDAIQTRDGDLERWAAFIGNVCRPLSILIATTCAGVASLIMANRVQDGNDGYLLAGAIWLGAGSLFIGKAVEVFKTNKANAQVETARVTAPPAANAG